MTAKQFNAALDKLGFTQLGLARKLEGVAVAPVGMQHKRILRRELAKVLLPVVYEVDLAQGLAAPVEPDIEPELMRYIWLI